MHSGPRSDAGDDLESQVGQLLERERLLQTANGELTHFASRAAHDLKGPIRSLEYYARLIRDEAAPPAQGLLESYFEDVDRILKGMDHLVNSLLEYALLSRTGTAFERIDLQSMLDDLVHDYAADISEVAAAVQITPLPCIVGNRVLIQQLFQNLLANALKYHEIERRPLIVAVSSTEFEGYWQFSVADSGLGIERRFHDKIFQAFERLHHRIEYDGSGLGLSLCKKVVELHGGRIWVQSEPGKGSNFQFTLQKSGGHTKRQ